MSKRKWPNKLIKLHISADGIMKSNRQRIWKLIDDEDTRRKIESKKVRSITITFDDMSYDHMLDEDMQGDIEGFEKMTLTVMYKE